MRIAGSTLDAFDECIQKLAKSDQELWFGHEAGRCGYVIYRHLKKGRHPCKTIVPSLIPTKASDPVKTDRRINEWLPAPFWSHRLVTSGRPGPGQFEG